MADIEWPISEEAIMAVMKERVNDHQQVLYGNGREGILDFIAGLKGQQRIMMALMIVVTAIATVVGTIVSIVAINVQKHTEEHAPQIFHSQSSQEAVNSKMDAQIPDLVGR